jgi:hypothetical protein
MRWGSHSAPLVILNVGLALCVHLTAPDAPRNTDRKEYEYVGRHGLAANCPVSVYCYRLLVPVALEQLPVEPDSRWRWYRTSATAVAGALTALTTRHVSGAPAAAVIASLLAQASYGFTFTAYDPFTTDPLVFVFAAAIAWCWIADRWQLALVLGLIGVFAKETVALVAASCGLAALARDRATWRAWFVSAGVVGAVLVVFHVVMDSFFGWGVGNSPAAALSQGSWLALWWQNNPFLGRKLFILFSPFAFAWVFAALGYLRADARLRQLALGAIVPFLALCYVQTPERALSNAFFIVVPLAAIYLASAPRGVALAAAIANGLVTAKVGSSTTWLPPSGVVLLPAALVAAYAIWLVERRPRSDRPGDRSGMYPVQTKRAAP